MGLSIKAFPPIFFLFLLSIGMVFIDLPLRNYFGTIAKSLMFCVAPLLFFLIVMKKRKLFLTYDRKLFYKFLLCLFGLIL